MCGGRCEIAKQLLSFERPRSAHVHRRGHMGHPVVAFRLADRERGMPGPQRGAAAFILVYAGPAEELGQEQAQVPAWLPEIVGIERPEQFVSCHPLVKLLGQGLEEFHTPEAFVHRRWHRRDFLANFG